MENRYDILNWDKLLQHLSRSWRQGEHVAVVGPTGCGKTTLLSRILPVRKYVVVLVTKIHDDTLKTQFPGFDRLEEWPPNVYQHHVLLWPKGDKTIRGTVVKQRDIFKSALDKIFNDRNWCVVFEEQHFICKKLGLSVENEMYLHQGRSSGLSVVNGTQRPAWVPVVTYDSSSHAFVWNTGFEADRKRLADLGGINRRAFEQNMGSLARHEFVYVDTRQGIAVRSQVKG
jgi:DNA polymerase III delta prime subunit